MTYVTVVEVPEGSTPLRVMTICWEPLPAVPVKLMVVDWPGARLVTGTDADPCEEVAVTLVRVVEAWLVTGTDTLRGLPGVTVGGVVDVTVTPLTVGVPAANGCEPLPDPPGLPLTGAVVVPAPQSPKAWSLTKNREASSEPQAFCWNPPMAVMVCWEAAPLEGSVAAVVTAPVVPAGTPAVVAPAPQSPKAWSLTKNREASSEPQAFCWNPPTRVMGCWEAAPLEGSVAAVVTAPVVSAGAGLAVAVVALAPQSPKAWSLTKNREASSEPQAFCWNPPMAVMVCCEAEPCWGAVAAVVTAPVVSAGAGVAG